MLPEFSLRIPNLPVDLEFVRDLEEFEGPILSEYRAADGRAYLEKWCARDGRITRTLLVRTERRAIAEYLSGRLSMRDLLSIPSDGVGFIVDRESDRDLAVYVTTLADLPESYLPGADSMHDESLRPDWDRVPQSFILEATWDARLLADIERRYLDAGCFEYLTRPDSERRLPETILQYQYDRGFPVAQAFAQIRAAVPAGDRPRSVSVSLSSPGVLTIDVPTIMAGRIATAIMSLARNQDAFKALHSWSRRSPRDIDRIPDTAIAFGQIEELCEVLDVAVATLFPNTRQSDFFAPRRERDLMAVLVAGKLLAAYCRRLSHLIEPQDDGVEFISIHGERPRGLISARYDDE